MVGLVLTYHDGSIATRPSSGCNLALLHNEFRNSVGGVKQIYSTGQVGNG